ncbi:MAG TPA: hypothetical protein VGN64_16820 [Dyadobacter sp.]|jgi:hypothetical protein|nr:hypothetical protein [Dyadobacter sp.]
MRFKNLFLFFIPALLFFTSCNNKEVEPRNQILKDGLSYELDKGALVGYGKLNEGDVGYTLHLYLMSPEISIVGKNEVPDSLVGKGHLLSFSMFSSMERELAPGTYAFDGFDTTNPETFGNAYTVFNANYTKKTGNENKLIAGKVVVARNGDQYKIDFDAVDDTGKKLVGHYTGVVSYFKGN